MESWELAAEKLSQKGVCVFNINDTGELTPVMNTCAAFIEKGSKPDTFNIKGYGGKDCLELIGKTLQ